MRMISILAMVIAIAVGAVAGATYRADAAAPSQPAPPSVCGDTSSAQLRTTLYFGTERPVGTVSELEWQIFLRDEVTKRFPEGLTVWDAQGQWRNPNGSTYQERSKVLLLVHADSPEARAFVLDVIARYRKMFDQQSVLWETARVCVSH